jgi:dihydroneopterin aldolase
MEHTAQTRLTLRSAEFYAYHGVKAEEQTLGGKYQVDIDMYYDALNAIINDSVKYALNYEEAMSCIEDVIAGESYCLVETIVNEILNKLMEKFPMLDKATCRVRKMNAPIRRVVSFIEAEQTLLRADYEKM